MNEIALRHGYNSLFILTLTHASLNLHPLKNNQPSEFRIPHNHHHVPSLLITSISHAIHHRQTASVMRFQFNDCFVNGCDGSMLMDDTNNTTSISFESSSVL
ncbi:unnamed protein product [Linum trigynum]|uniref:Plant heme peroxidase family profile domain-containing protein n=1 Tax=Linum trigynum TaxID=586398 RepID=A0AAV2GQ66_9ROSI